MSVETASIPISEIAKMPEYKVEGEHKTNYGSFGQELFVRTHRTERGIVRKIAGLSLPYPLEVKREDVVDIMKLATAAEDVEVKGWDGVKKGRIESFAVDRDNGLDPGFEIKRFIWASKTILEDRYGKTADQRSKGMNKYFDLLKIIWHFSDEVARDVNNILNNPDCTYWSAFNERYFQKGIILIEGIQKNGVVKGMPPFGGEPVSIVGVAIDEPHQLFLRDGYIAEVESAKGDKIIADCEDTETVRDCRGSRGCSEFFDIMENGIVSMSQPITDVQSGGVFVKVVDSLGRLYLVCFSCQKIKESCNCNNSSTAKDKN